MSNNRGWQPIQPPTRAQRVKTALGNGARSAGRSLAKYIPIIARGIGRGLSAFARFVWTWVLIPAWRALTAFVRITAVRPWRGESPSRSSWAFGGLWGIILCTLVFVGYQIWPSGEQSASMVEIIEETADQVVAPTSTTGACGTKCQETIRESRSRLRGIEENEVRYVLKQYNAYVASAIWRTKAQNCYEQYWEHFAAAQRYTMYPAELIAGKALIEGDGCRFVDARNGDGGKGPMQITHPDDRHIRATGIMLGTSYEGVRWKSDYRHNVLLGTVMLSDFEDMFGSRGVGILAYNRGPGNVRKDMRRASITSDKRRVISDFRGGIPERAGRGGKPRIYVDKILAGAVIMSRLAQGKGLVPLETMNLGDIPGSDPSKDHL